MLRLQFFNLCRRDVFEEVGLPHAAARRARPKVTSVPESAGRSCNSSELQHLPLSC